jgi:DNA-binding HxlR family transcriptional regulator
MPTEYGQFCPVAKAMELLDERWTLLVVRELMLGSRHFNAIRRGVPKMSPALLSKRLHALVRAGVVERWQDGNRVSYQLSQSGKELAPIVEALGHWGVRWVSELGDADLDPHLLMWDIRRSIDHEAVPAGRTVIAFEFSDVAAKQRCWWLVIDANGIDVCDFDPGHDVTVTVRTTLRILTEIWRGDISWDQSLRGDRVTLLGSRQAQRALPRWLGQSNFAAIPRPVAMLAR